MNATPGIVVPAGGGRHLDMGAPGYVEEMLHRRDPMNDAERKELRERYHWDIIGPNPL